MFVRIEIRDETVRLYCSSILVVCLTCHMSVNAAFEIVVPIFLCQTMRKISRVKLSLV